MTHSTIQSRGYVCDRCRREPIPLSCLTLLYEFPATGKQIPTVKGICPACVPVVRAELEMQAQEGGEAE